MQRLTRCFDFNTLPIAVAPLHPLSCPTQLLSPHTDIRVVLTNNRSVWRVELQHTLLSATVHRISFLQSITLLGGERQWFSLSTSTTPPQMPALQSLNPQHTRLPLILEVLRVLINTCQTTVLKTLRTDNSSR